MKIPRGWIAGPIAVGLVATMAAGSFAAGKGYVDAKGRIQGCVGKHGVLSVVKTGKSCPAHTTDLTFGQPTKPAPVTWKALTDSAAGSCETGKLCSTANVTWANYSSSFSAVAYSRSADGEVRLRGLVKAFLAASVPTCDGGPDSTIFDLPHKDRPAATEIFVGGADDGVTEGAATIYVNTDGTVVCNDGAFTDAGSDFLSLSGIEFSAAS